MPFRNKPNYLVFIITWFTVVIGGLMYSFLFVNEAPAKQIYNNFNVHYIDDTTSPLSLEQVHALPESVFANDKETLHSPDKMQFSMWYKISVNGDERFRTPFSVTVDNPTLDNIDFYLYHNEKVAFEKTLGDQSNAKYVIDYVAPQISLFRGMGADTIIYIRIRTNGVPATPILIAPIENSIYRTSAQLILLGSLFGIGMMMIIYNYFMFRSVGDLSYLHYIAYVSCAVTAISMINGFTFLLFPPQIASWANKYVIMPMHLFSLAFAVKFAISFLRFETIKPWFVEAGEKFVWVLYGLAVMSLVISEGALVPVYSIVVVLGYIYSVALMIIVIRTKLVWVRYYLVSWLPLLVGTTISVNTFNGNLPYNFFTKNASLLGVLLEICIMAIALLDRFRANQVERDYRINHDLATGLPNQMLLESAIKTASQHNQPIALVVFEITQSKDVIPSLGTETANRLFAGLFDNVHTSVRSMNDVHSFANSPEGERLNIVRIDESKFALMFVGHFSDLEYSTKIFTIQDAASSIVNVDGLSMSISTTAGVASYPSDTVESEKLLSMAMQALVVARTTDKSWARYDEQRSVDIKQKFRLAADLQSAIEEAELELYHQPQIDMINNRVHGSEALLRWVHPVEGFVSPDFIVQIAEEMGIIHQLTEWVIDKSFEQHTKLYKLGFEVNVSINISGKDFNHNGLIAHILTSTARHSVIPSTVTFEVTESATAEDPKHVQRVLGELYDQGFKIAIDDFGTGYSSLDYLSQLPFHELKIDKGFMNIDVSDRNKTITEVTLLLAQKLGVNAVAEGIETQEVADMLKEFGCPIGQGYLYSKPKPFIEYMRWLQELYKNDRNLLIDA